MPDLLHPRPSRRLLARIPKSDLHVHLDGSLRLGTLIELAAANGVDLPSRSEEGLKELVFKPQYRDLSEYLAGFAYTVAVMQRPEDIERIAFELAEDVIGEGVRYIEVRFAPQLHVRTGQEVTGVLSAVAAGLERAARRHNAHPAVDFGTNMPFRYGIICCAMRNFSPEMSPYYAALVATLPESPHKEVVALASLEMARAGVAARDEAGLPIVGFDLAGEEAGYRAGHHANAYHEAHRHFLRKTVHAGEAYGPESIYEAITLCHAERIGHGTFLFSPERIRDSRIADPAAYVDALAEYMAFTRITVEVCPTSNLQTIPQIGTLSQHPIRHMIDHGLSVAVATDNRLVSHTTLTDELHAVAQAMKLDWTGMRRLVLAGFKGAFYPGRYAGKRTYVEQAAAAIDAAAADEAAAEGDG